MNELSLFNTLFGDDEPDLGFNFPVFSAKTVTAPKVDVKETKDCYALDMDLPGKTEKDVDLSIDDNVLTISSHHEEAKEEKSDKKEEGSWLIRERRSYNFSRRFTLPQDVDSEGIKASFKNGVLHVNMPRKALPQPKKIAIEVA